MDLETVDTSNPWTMVHEEARFDTPYFSARRDLVRFDRAAARPYSSVRVRYHGVCVAPIDQEGCVTLVGQFRYVLDRYTWELPGGGCLVGGDPAETARAELSEETGLAARHLLKVVEGAVSSGTSDEIVPGYVAWGLAPGHSHPDREERLTLRRVSFSEALEMALRGEIAHLIGSTLLLGIHVKRQRGELPLGLAELLHPG
jgi:8-oxo-dGTP pyrophosphatase MutT (NUDIX family)